MGGLGNQLFQLAVAIHLRDVIGVPVVLDRQFYFHEFTMMDPRDFEISQLPHGFTVIRERGRSTRFRALPRALHRRLITRWARVDRIDNAIRAARETNAPDPRSRALAELAASEPPWFQSAFAPQANATAMRALLETRIPAAFVPERKAPYIGVHSRLGDYLNQHWQNDLGATDPASLIELGRQLSQKHGGLPIRVFTDSPEVFEHLCPESRVGPYEMSDAVSSWDALTGMARSHAFVMSNSTLSWWAAFIATTYRDEEVDILMPHPWHLKTRTRDELLRIPGWTRFERCLLPASADLSPFER
jgi:hypothetical protein